MSLEDRLRRITQGGDDPDQLLTKAETARLLRVSERTVERLQKRGALPATRIGKAVRYRDADVRRVIREGA